MILEPIIISLKVSSISTLITLMLGIFLARIFTKYNFKGKDILETIIMLPMVLPPSVIGYGLLMIIGSNGIIGKIFLELFNKKLIFNITAACIASTIVALPLMYQSVKSAFLNIDILYENVARTLGADERTIFWKISFPLAFQGIISGIVLAFARSIGEFGATLMVAGNIPGKTQTIPLAIYFAAEGGDNKTANILMTIVIVFSFIIVYGLNRWSKSKKY
ncbi:molybdate ABC transporter permease subunit [Clostridium senegalense]|uniref:molybdate ABC transporter permease subunit n=1 Tax=Clostridium senegalense TaxID=1465809 RepID=UPI000287CB2A|nr:molybdate ABC transporter permease subunit [Clostridium senegalense]MBU5226869.1 molybdate ABC transporter permease subunit [Clostridium senegalense]